MTEQRFTDEDVRRLKEQAEREWENPVELSPAETKALLARLKAAENVRRFIPHSHGDVLYDVHGCMKCDADRAWRQVLGK